MNLTLSMPDDHKIEQLLAPEESALGWPWKMFLTMATLFGVVSAGYLGLAFGYRPYLEGKIADVKKDIDDLAKSLPLDEQQKFLKFYSQIVNVKALLGSHTTLTKLFDFLEKNTNTRVTYENVHFDASRRELAIDGVADSYARLAEQLQAFGQATNSVERYIVSQSRVVDGKVRFRMTATIAEKLLR